MKNTNMTIFLEEAPVLKFIISGKKAYIKITFSMKCLEIMFEEFEKSANYRCAFIKTVYHMYQETDNDQYNSLTIDDFNKESDEVIVHIIERILEQDNKLKEIYNKVEAGTPYERFYNANKMLYKEATKNISYTLMEVSKTFKAFGEAILRSVNCATDKDTGFNIMISSFRNISKPTINVDKILSPLQSALKSVQFANEEFLSSFTSLSLLTESIQSIYSSFDFSMLTYYNEWNTQRETLLEYDWFYSREFPEELINKIHENRENLSKDEVNTIIVSYFRENGCKAVKDIIKQWNGLSCFSCRQDVFNEAVENHVDERYNSSITLLTIQTEGVITDFVRINLQKPRYRINQAISDIKQGLNDNDKMSIYEFKVFSDVIENIEDAFLESFDYANPDISSNNSRHKVAHGHVYIKESEVNSLKKFLYLNEVYHMFILSEKKI